MLRCVTPLLALALVPLAGCSRGEPAADPLLVISGPKAFLRLELRDAGDRVLWRLVADEPAPLSLLFYGRVPQGFRQEIPARGGPPRALFVGEPLTLESTTPLRVFNHEGVVASRQRFSINNSRMRLRQATPGVEPSPAD